MTDHKRALAAHVASAARRAEKNYKAEYPASQSLRVKVAATAYKPRQAAVSDIPIKAVGLFMNEPASLEWSNAKIAEHLAREVGARVPANILTEALKPRHVTRITEALAVRGVEIDLSTHNTASKIKLALRARATSLRPTVRFSGEVSFSGDAVVVGDRSYPIQLEGRIPRIQVGKSKLNVETLKALLCETR